MATVCTASLPNRTTDRWRRAFICHYISAAVQLVSEELNPAYRTTGEEVPSAWPHVGWDGRLASSDPPRPSARDQRPFRSGGAPEYSIPNRAVLPPRSSVSSTASGIAHRADRMADRRESHGRQTRPPRHGRVSSKRGTKASGDGLPCGRSANGTSPRLPKFRMSRSPWADARIVEGTGRAHVRLPARREVLGREAVEESGTTISGTSRSTHGGKPQEPTACTGIPAPIRVRTAAASGPATSSSATGSPSAGSLRLGRIRERDRESVRGERQELRDDPLGSRRQVREIAPADDAVEPEAHAGAQTRSNAGLGALVGARRARQEVRTNRDPPRGTRR